MTLLMTKTMPMKERIHPIASYDIDKLCDVAIDEDNSDESKHVKLMVSMMTMTTTTFVMMKVKVTMTSRRLQAPVMLLP